MLTSDGKVYSQDLSGRSGMNSLLTGGIDFGMYDTTPNVDATSEVLDTNNEPNKPNLLWILFALFLIVVAMKFAMEHEKSGMQPHFIGIGLWNFVAIGLMVTLFIIVEKTILNKFYVKGVTELVNIV